MHTRLLVEFSVPDGFEFKGLDFAATSGNCRVYLVSAAGFAVGDGEGWQDAADAAVEKLVAMAARPRSPDIVKKSEKAPRKLFTRKAAPLAPKEEDDLLGLIGAALKRR